MNKNRLISIISITFFGVLSLIYLIKIEPASTKQNQNKMTNIATDKNITNKFPNKKDCIIEIQIEKNYQKTINSKKNFSKREKDIQAIFNCEECIEELKDSLLHSKYDDSFEKIVNKISSLNSKKSIEFLLDILNEFLNQTDIDIEKIEAIKNSLKNFNNIQTIKPLLSFWIKMENNSKISDQVSHSIKKAINISFDPKIVGEKLFEIYQNSANNEKNRILKFNNAYLYSNIAIDAYKNDDEIKFEKVLKNLSYTDTEETVKAFMEIAKNIIEDEAEKINPYFTEWIKNNYLDINKLSDIGETYITRDDLSTNEKIFAIMMINKMKDTNKKNQILNKALQYENDTKVIEYISNILK